MNTANFFEHYYNNAQVNSILIMGPDGTVLDVNNSFTKNFGYRNEDIKGKNFSLLFNEADKQQNKPQLELNTVTSTGQSNDENYVVDRHGNQVWCTGESILVVGKDGEKYIVKDIVNLQAKKQLQLFLTETEELLQRIFESSTDIPMMILDGTMKIQKVNAAFRDLFEIQNEPKPGCRISDLDHPFWNNPDVKKELSRIIVTNEPLRHKEFSFQTKSGEQKTVRLDSKVIERHSSIGRIIFIIMEEVADHSSLPADYSNPFKA
jgi:PAS domain S-box-containing protein